MPLKDPSNSISDSNTKILHYNMFHIGVREEKERKNHNYSQYQKIRTVSLKKMKMMMKKSQKQLSKNRMTAD
jgi:hypothetical protein